MTEGNFAIYCSVAFFLLTKIFGVFLKKERIMYNKQGSILTSIPENIEEEEVRKWVPKKKHEVLKAKYKCLKKLFQIYDASVIGMLPESYDNDCEVSEKSEKRTRKKRSNRTKTDACAGTSEVLSGDSTDVSEIDKGSTIATTVMPELKVPQYSCTSTQFDATTVTQTKYDSYSTTQNSKTNITEREYKESEYIQRNQMPQPIPYLLVNERPKLTRFQIFIQRIFGIKQERSHRNFYANEHIYAASDNIVTPHFVKRKRRGLRFRKLRKPKKIQSESALRKVKSPMILTYVQSVQKNCLMDTTPRQCPILGCRMIFYGIINYNDHLNLCHFTERKFICHYCHEGFECEHDKYLHENEHIGIGKLNSNILTVASASRQPRKASNTQTDPELTKNDLPEEKLKKIVSFFDKISDPDNIISEIKKNRYSESNLHTSQTSKDDTTVVNTTATNSETDKRTVSCVNLQKTPKARCVNQVDSKFPYNSPVKCHFCGENFDYRRQLSLHVDLEHRVHDKFSKFHSCAGITNQPNRRYTGKTSRNEPKFENSNISEETLRRKSEESLSYEPSTNIVYYTSTESVHSKVPCGYKWEPGTKIIRV